MCSTTKFTLNKIPLFLLKLSFNRNFYTVIFHRSKLSFFNYLFSVSIYYTISNQEIQKKSLGSNKVNRTGLIL